MNRAVVTSKKEKKDEKFFAFGAWAFVQVPEEKWEADVKAMKEAGFNTVATPLEWKEIETAPKKYNWRKIDKIIKLAKKYDMKLLLSIGWINPRLTKEVSNGFMSNSEGNYIYADGLFPLICFDHPGWKEEFKDFLEAVAERYKDEETILIWDVSGEPHLPAWHTEGDKNFCFCTYTKLKFIEWLKNKYDSIEKLNEVWKTPFSDWSEVSPPRKPPSVWGNSAAWMDWRLFMTENLAESVGFVSQTLKKHGITQLTETHVLETGGIGNIAMEGGDYWLLAKNQDILGCTLFAKVKTNDPPLHSALILDTMKSAAKTKKIMVTESQGGYQLTAAWGLHFPSVQKTLNLPLHRAVGPTPEDVKIWSWQAIAHGAKGFIFWAWRPRLWGYEFGEWGLCNINGTYSERVKSGGEVVGVLNENLDFFLNSNPLPSKIAILKSLSTQILASGEEITNFPPDAIIGTYKALWEENIPVDFITPEEINEKTLSKYKLLILPFAYTMNQSVGEEICRFVEKGGNILADGFCATRDEHGGGYEILPGAGLNKVFCCQKFDTICMDVSDIIFLKGTANLCFTTRANLKGYKITERIRPLKGGRTIAVFKDGSPAIIFGEYDKGKAMYVGTFLMIQNSTHKNAGVHEFLNNFVNLCGIEAPIDVETIPEKAKRYLECRLLERGEELVLISINHNNLPVMTEIKVKGIEREVLDLEGREKISFKIKYSSTILSLSYKPKEVKILKLF